MKEHLLGLMFVETRVDIKFCDDLIDWGSKSSKDHSPFLAGQIKKEIKFEDEYQQNIHEYIFPIINRYVNKFIERYDYDLLFEQYKINFSDAWINYQRALEYNPLHNHTGDISYVIYANVPEEIDTEVSHDRSIPPGSITFRTGSMNHTRYPEEQYDPFELLFRYRKETTTFRPRKGDMFIFPASLEHVVQRFLTPDIERISISGNALITREMRNE